jgi:Fe-S cluster biogenesis protein NfuA
MFIQTELTPNPSTIKFIPGTEVLKEGTKQYNNVDEAENSPLAQSLFAIDGVKAVFLAQEFISVTKKDVMEWSLLKAEVLTTITDHFVSGAPVLSEESGDAKAADTAVDDDPLSAQIREIIDTRVRPAVAQDGGDIIFHGFEDGIVKLEMHGACSGCPSSSITLKNGIENMLKHYIPEVLSVEQV